LWCGDTDVGTTLTAQNSAENAAKLSRRTLYGQRRAMRRSSGMTATDAAEVPRWLRWATVALVAGMVIVGWGPRLLWGLWLDETFTAWQVQDGWSAIIPAKLTNPGQSALYAFLEAPFYFPHSPHMELWLRVPSLLGTAASCFFLYRLTERLVGKGTGAFAVLALVGNISFIYYSTEARPYTLAVAACLASLWGLVCWLETGERRHGLTFAVSLAIAVHLHLMFALFPVVPAFLIFDRVQRGDRVDWWGLARYLSVAAVLLAPLLFLARDFLHGSGGLAPFRLPDFSTFIETAIPGSVVLAAFGLLILLPPWRKPVLLALSDSVARRVFVFSLVWILVPPLLLLFISRVIHQKVLFDRYFAHAVAGQALIVAVAYRGFPPILARMLLLACFIPFPIRFGLRDAAEVDGPGSWRRPVQAIRALDPKASAPVFVQAGHPLANAADWRHAIERRTFVYSQLAAYPLSNHVFPVPYTLDEATTSYVRGVADAEVAEAPLIFYAGLSTDPISRWMCEFFESRGYTKTVAIDKSVGLIVFRKAHAGERP
jgi:hypothetical protein